MYLYARFSGGDLIKISIKTKMDVFRRLSVILQKPDVISPDGDSTFSQEAHKKLNISQEFDSLGFTWLHTFAPCFPVDGNKVTVIHEPNIFYKTVVERCRTAKRRITLASLYLGTGHLEEQLVAAISENLRASGDQLKVKVLLDHTRGSRGEPNSRRMLLPLLNKYKDLCQVSLYHTPVLRGLLHRLMPERYNEVLGLQHMKVYLFDDSLLISGPTDSTKVVALIEDGNSQRYVAAVLGIPQSTIQRVYHCFRETGGYSRRPGSGRKRVTSAHDDHFIVLNTLRDRHSAAVETRRALQEIRQVSVSERTVRKHLDESGLKSRRPAKGPELLQQHHVERLCFAHNHANWNLGECSRVSFQGGSVMVWDGILYEVRTELVFINGGALTAPRYIEEVLIEHVVPYVPLIGEELLLMHAAKIVDEFLHDVGLNRMAWPARSPDINPIEHVWGMPGKRSYLSYRANLSNDYFTNRQDRYVLIEDCGPLADFYDGLVSRVSEFSLQLDQGDQVHLHSSWKYHPYKGKKGEFKSAAKDRVWSYISSTMTQQQNHGISDAPQSGRPSTSEETIMYQYPESNSRQGNFFDNEDALQTWLDDFFHSKPADFFRCTGDTWIFPLVEMGQLGLHQDSCVTKKMFETALPGSIIHLATGYFNLTQEYTISIINHSAASFNILMAHPTANGFLGAQGPAGGIPAAYTLLASAFFKQHQISGQEQRIQMAEFQKKGWTYHAKGLWYTLPSQNLPILTLVGSPNFGNRSVCRDLETQIAIVTKNPKLQQNLLEERERLYASSTPFTSETLSQPDRKYAPLWVHMAVRLFRNLL
ncbi:hypothetical protein ANN_06186 [Periplaneta americana]|uniref:CDP-diacylglycerol--glycerol-3-phosphate 3-phosphatidyltransferase n=1 Tax=Periplaneta americana TaxID=6978 RepID=A0ABQ8TEM0_PERAM|nr:hypothetical protein ANN_06186 [Periplaneta americana]